MIAISKSSFFHMAFAGPPRGRGGGDRGRGRGGFGGGRGGSRGEVKLFSRPLSGRILSCVLSDHGAAADHLQAASAVTAVHEEEGVVVFAALHKVVGVRPEGEGAGESLG